MGLPLTAVPEVRLSANPFTFNNLDDFVNACSPVTQRPRAAPPRVFAPTILSRLLPREPGTGAGAWGEQNMGGHNAGRALVQSQGAAASFHR